MVVMMMMVMMRMLVMMAESKLPVPRRRSGCARASRQLLGIVAVAVWRNQDAVPRGREVLPDRKVPVHPHAVQWR